MFAILKREFKNYFCTVTGPLFVAVNLFFLGLYFTAINLNMGYSRVAYTVQSVVFVFLIMAPVLSMRSMAEEKRQKTDQLLFTSPVSDMRIIWGKYLGMVMVFAVPVLVLCIYPVILGFFGHVSIAESYVAILAYFLFGCTCLAIGLFVSSLTENLIIAAVCTFAILLAAYLMAGIKEMVSTQGGIVTKIMSAFDIASPMSPMFQGVLNLRSVIYYVLVILLMLFYTHQHVNKRRYEFGRRAAGRILLSGTGTLLVTAVFIAIYWGSAYLPETMKNVDVTENSLYEIGDETRSYLAGMQEEANIYVLAKEETYDESVKQLLYRYEEGSPKIHVSYVDIYTNPDFARQYNVDNASEGSLLVVSGKRSKYIHASDLFETEIDYTTYSQKAVGFDGEGQITAALDYVLRDDLPVAYVVTGHDELPLSGTLADMLSKANIETREVNLMTGELDPAQGDAVLMLAPTTDYSADDVKKVRDFLEAGGNALIISTYTGKKLENFDSLMEERGVSLVSGIVVEGDAQHYYQMPTYLLPEIGTDTLTASLISGKRYVLMPYAQGAVAGTVSEDGVSISKLLTTSDLSYAKSDTENAKTMDKEEGDVSGPFALGLLYEKQRDSGTMKILYFTGESIIDESMDAMVGGANISLVAQGISSMMGEQESRIVIPSKSFEDETIIVPRNLMVMGACILVGVVPFLVLIIGIVIWTKRRRL